MDITAFPIALAIVVWSGNLAFALTIYQSKRHTTPLVRNLALGACILASTVLVATNIHAAIAFAIAVLLGSLLRKH